MASGKISAPDSGFVEVVADGSKTYATLIRELARKVDINKLKANYSFLSISNSGISCTLNQKVGSVLRFGSVITFSSTGFIHGFQVTDDTDAGYFRFILSGSSITYENKSNEKPDNGTIFRIKY
jgi:hypothetical protein